MATYSKKLSSGRSRSADIYALVDSAFNNNNSDNKDSSLSDPATKKKRNRSGDDEKSSTSKKTKVNSDNENSSRKHRKKTTSKSSNGSSSSSSSSKVFKDSKDSFTPAFEPVVEESNLYNGRTVYIEGLPFTATEEEITSFFESSGCGAIQQMRLPRWQDSGRLKGNGHVEFSTAESVEKALKMNGKYMNQRYIKVERPLPPKNAISTVSKEDITVPAGCNTVFIKNLPYDTEETEVEEYFKVFGPITSVRLARWGHTNQLKGFGYVTFKREDSAEICVKKSKVQNAVVFKSRVILCDFETGAPKMSFQRQEQKQKIAQKSIPKF